MRSTVTCALLVGIIAVGPPLRAQRQCGPADKPKDLPAVSALLDSARVVTGLAPADLAPNGVVFSLVYTAADSIPQVHVLEAPIDSAGLLLSGAFVPQKSKQPWAVRVRIGGINSLAVTIERSTYCPPVLLDKQTSLREIFMVNPRPGDRFRDNPVNSLLVDVFIAETGQVADVRLSQSSGMREFDEQLVTYFRLRRWAAALIDGFPIQSWYRSDGRTMRM